VTESNYIF